MLTIFVFVLSMVATISVILIITTGIALYEFSGEKEVVEKWWNTMLLNMSAAFSPLFNFITVVPRRMAMWAATHAFTAAMIAATFVLYEVVGDDYGMVFEKLEVGYHDFIQLFALFRNHEERRIRCTCNDDL